MDDPGEQAETKGDDRSSRPPWLGQDARGWDHMRVHVQVLRDPKLGAIELAVYLGLVAHAELSTGHCFPAVATLASYANVDARTARRALSVLTKAGYLDVVERRGKANEYLLLPPPPLTETLGVEPEDPEPLTFLTGAPLTSVSQTPDTDVIRTRTTNKNHLTSSGPLTETTGVAHAAGPAVPPRYERADLEHEPAPWQNPPDFDELRTAIGRG